MSTQVVCETASNLSAITGATPSANTYLLDFTATFGTVAALVSTTFTRTFTGLLTTDAVYVSCVGSPVSGMIIGNCRVSSSNVLEMSVSTAVALGISLGSLVYRTVIVR